MSVLSRLSLQSKLLPPGAMPPCSTTMSIESKHFLHCLPGSILYGEHDGEHQFFCRKGHNVRSTKLPSNPNIPNDLLPLWSPLPLKLYDLWLAVYSCNRLQQVDTGYTGPCNSCMLLTYTRLRISKHTDRPCVDPVSTLHRPRPSWDLKGTRQCPIPGTAVQHCNRWIL